VPKGEWLCHKCKAEMAATQVKHNLPNVLLPFLIQFIIYLILTVGWFVQLLSGFESCK